jgi:endonuclease III
MTARKPPAVSRPQSAPKPVPKKATPAAKSAAKPAVKAVAKVASKPTGKAVAKTASKPPVKASGKPAAKPPAGKPAAKLPAGKPAAAKPAPVVAPKPVPEKIPPRGTLVPKLHKALKATYKPVAIDTSRSMLDQVLVACCFENAQADVAEKAFTRLVATYFDLNEIRVTTVAELAEVLHDLPDPARAALSLRRALQGVFESTYSYSLDHARKHSLAHGIKVLEGLRGVPPFVVQHVAATALGGHLIPLDKGALAALWLCGLITRQEYDTGKVPGLERAISKKAGIEFSSLLHQFGIDVLTNLHGTTVRKVVLAANPAAKDRFPKRGEPLPEPVPPPFTGKEVQKEEEEYRPAGPQAAARPAGKTPQPPAGSGPKKPETKGKSGPKPFVVKPLSIKPKAAAAPEPTPPAAEPKAAPKDASPLSKRKPR